MVAVHSATATVAITRPAYDVYHPSVPLWSTGFETGSHSLAGEGFTGPVGSRCDQGNVVLPHSGAWSAQIYTRYMGVGPPSPMTATFTKTLTGLTVGRIYTASCYASQLTGGSPANRTERVRLGVAGVATGEWITLTTAWKFVPLTFTATATTHVLQLSGGETDTGTGGSSLFYVDDMRVDAAGWTEHFPPTIGEPIPLEVKTVDATLDDSWAPYGQITVECFIPSQEVLEFVDPRQLLRAVVTLTDGTVTRTFNGLVRSRDVDHNAGQMTLTIGTDEARLIDEGRVASTVDSTALAYQASLRTLINTVILAPIGAVLETDDGADADLTVYADQTNLIPNPSAETNLLTWTASGCTLARLASAVSGVTGSYVFQLTTPTNGESRISADAIPVTPGQTYVFSGDFFSSGTPTGAQSVYARRLVVVTTGGTVLAQSGAGDPAATVMNRVNGTVTIPAGVTSIVLRAYGGYATTQNIRWDAIKFAAATSVLDNAYFDGDTPDSLEYFYDWTDTAHASTSTRTDMTLTERSVDMFRWPPGVSAWDFIQPLVQAGALRLFCDEEMKWHLVDPLTFAVPGVVQIDATVNATNATDTIDRTGEWWDSVVIMYQWTDDNGLTQTRYDVAGGANTKTLLVEKRVPFPGYGAAAALLTRVLERGRVMSLEAVSIYTVTPGQALHSALPNTAAQEATVTAVTWSQPDDEMRVTSRGAIDSDLTTASWLWLGTGVKWTDSAVGASWVSEPI